MTEIGYTIACIAALAILFGIFISMTMIVKLLKSGIAAGGSVIPAAAPRAAAAFAESPAAVRPAAAAKSDSSGEVVLQGVSDSDAALIMAIVADSSGVPPEQLKFKSIKLAG